MIRVKFLARRDPLSWTPYFPNADGCWGRCQFLFDPDETAYDWLVVLDDLPAAPGRTRKTARTPLHCPPCQTILVTTEPESIKTYGRGYCHQFGHVITSQPAWALAHPARREGHSGNHWFYGDQSGRPMDRERLLKGPDPTGKQNRVSVVHSPKRMRHTRHHQRYHFVEALKQQLPELLVYGRNGIPLDDKAEALDGVRYHLALENHIGRNHITEKLTDAFLGRCLPFYAGAPNAADYFPEQSFIAITMDDPSAVAARIREVLASDLWIERLPAIEEARRRVLEQEHLFALIDRCIAAAASSPGHGSGVSDLLGRHAWRRRHPLASIGLQLEKASNRWRSR